MSFKLFFKKHFNGIYRYYQHLQRVCFKNKANKYKKKSVDQAKKIIEKVYFKKIGAHIDWSNPERYTEKMQISKLFYANQIKADLSDKFKVRDWVSKKIGDDYLIPLLGVWDSFSEINFSVLPKQFVLKTNHGSGTILIVKDKDKMDYKDAKSKINDWMNTDYGYTTYFETHYSLIDRKIIAEKYLETDLGELQDYKFLCFNGRPYFCWVDLGRFSNHTRTVFDMEWKLQPWTQAQYGISKAPIEKPKNFDKMIEIATILSKGFDQVRVDLYNINGKIYFGEMTFTNGSGLDQIVPDEYDKVLGSLWQQERIR